MLGSIRKFSKSFLAKIFIAIIALPFVMWGMGDVFRSGKQNILVEINDEKIISKGVYLSKSALAEKAGLNFKEAKVEAEETPEAETIAAEKTESPSDPVASEEEEVKAEKPIKKTRAKAKKAEKETEPNAEEKQEDSVEEETESS